MTANRYMNLINCSTFEEVYAKVRSWSSDLSDHVHLVRSTILDIHLDIERVLKQILYHVLLGIIFHGEDEAEYELHCKKLEEMVSNLNFATVHRLLRPAFEAFAAPDLANIQPINQLRNSVAHAKDVENVLYKGRSPFTDPDCLAQLYFDGWAVRQELGHFFERMIDDPRRLMDHYASFYRENYDRLKGNKA